MCEGNGSTPLTEAAGVATVGLAAAQQGIRSPGEAMTTDVTEPWAEARPRGGTLMSPAQDLTDGHSTGSAVTWTGRRRNSSLIVEQ